MKLTCRLPACSFMLRWHPHAPNPAPGIVVDFRTSAAVRRRHSDHTSPAVESGPDFLELHLLSCGACCGVVCGCPSFVSHLFLCLLGSRNRRHGFHPAGHPGTVPARLCPVWGHSIAWASSFPVGGSHDDCFFHSFGDDRQG